MDHLTDLGRGVISLMMSFEPATRNVGVLCACVVIYAVFLHRDQRAGGRRRLRPLRCADSVLRGY